MYLFRAAQILGRPPCYQWSHGFDISYGNVHSFPRKEYIGRIVRGMSIAGNHFSNTPSTPPTKRHSFVQRVEKY